MRLLSKHIVGFDYLRAICCLMVVLHHSDGLRIFAFNETISQMFSVYYMNIGLLAVPIFFQVSLYLFYAKRQTQKDYFWKTSLPKLLLLYGFWTSLFMSVKLLIGDFSFYERFGTVANLLATIITAGESLFYFLFSLLLITGLADLSLKIKAQYQIPENRWRIYETLGLIISLIYVVWAAPFTLESQQQLWAVHSNPLNFIPYIFSSYFIFQAIDRFIQKKSYNLKKEINRVVIPLAVAAILCGAIEWQLLYRADFFADGLLPHYTRISSFFASTAIVYLVILLPLQPNNIITFLSRCSLGIYCFHKFLPNVLGIALDKVLTTLWGVGIQDNIPLMSSILCVNWILFSILLTVMFSKIKFLRRVL
ncbi:MAG: acyltransferase [Spirulina sp. SIO3F2]|nr:acyltransferase [Spirulina sp. SIO3F2]